MDFGRIYEEYFRELQRYLLSLCRDSRIAEELTQETFFRAVRSAGQFREGSDLRAWLYTIARNVFLDQARRKRNTEIQLPRELPDTAGVTLTEALEDPGGGPAAPRPAPRPGGALQGGVPSAGVRGTALWGHRPGIWADGELGAGDLLSGQAEDHRGIGGGEAWRIDPWAAG